MLGYILSFAVSTEIINSYKNKFIELHKKYKNYNYKNDRYMALSVRVNVQLSEADIRVDSRLVLR